MSGSLHAVVIVLDTNRQTKEASARAPIGRVIIYTRIRAVEVSWLLIFCCCLISFECHRFFIILLLYEPRHVVLGAYKRCRRLYNVRQQSARKPVTPPTAFSDVFTPFDEFVLREVIILRRPHLICDADDATGFLCPVFLCDNSSRFGRRSDSAAGFHSSSAVLPLMCCTFFCFAHVVATDNCYAVVVGLQLSFIDSFLLRWFRSSFRYLHDINVVNIWQ